MINRPRHHLSPEEAAARDARILKVWNAGGVSVRDIAARFSLSKDGVDRVLAKARDDGKEVRRMVPKTK
jgi:transposase